MYAFESAGGGSIADAAPAAAAVEFAAAGGSVLDDLQDLDPVPGIEPGVPGAGAELVALLLVLSQSAMAALDVARIPPERVLAAGAIFTRYELAALSAQHGAIKQSREADVTLEEAIRAACAKSGSIGRLAAEVGATLASADAECIARHGDFGWNAAVVDQMQNDVAGVWPGGEASTDLLLGRKTAPIAFALQVPAGASAAAGRVKQAFQAGARELANEGTLREALFQSGGVHFAWMLAALHRARAMRIARDRTGLNPSSRLGDLLLV